MKHTEHARRTSFVLSDPGRRGGAAANALVGLLVVGAVGVGVWKLQGGSDAVVEADPDEVERTVAEGVGDGGL